MSGIFASPFRKNESFKEGYVTNVDPDKYVCAVRTTDGQTLTNVPWLNVSGGTSKGGIHAAPEVFDKVLITTSLGYPLILGTISRMGLTDANVQSISGVSLGVGIGSSSDLKNGYSLNPNKPNDFAPGDKVLTSSGGGLFAVLSSGGIIAKASNLAQIFISKFNGLVRIVARNFYRFSDASSEVSVSIKGTLYHWFGLDWDLNRNTTNTERYNEALGHIPAAKLMRGNPSSQVVVPVRDTRVREHWLKDIDGNEVMVETLYEDGKIVLTIRQPSIASETVSTQDDALWQTTVTKETTSKITILPESVYIDYNAKSSALFNEEGIHLKYDGSTTIDLNDTGIEMNAKGHFTIIDSSGVHLG